MLRRWVGRDFGRIHQKSRAYHILFPGIHPDPNRGQGRVELDPFYTHPGGVCVNGVENIVCLAAIRIYKGVVWRVDGLAEILVGPPRNHGRASAISPDPPAGT